MVASVSAVEEQAAAAAATAADMASPRQDDARRTHRDLSMADDALGMKIQVGARPSPVFVAREWPERSPFTSPIRNLMSVDHGEQGAASSKTDNPHEQEDDMMRHRMLLAASFDTMSDGGSFVQRHQHDGTSSLFDDTTSVLPHTMMLESPIPQKSSASVLRYSMVLHPRSRYHDDTMVQQKRTESREEEQQDDRTMLQDGHSGGCRFSTEGSDNGEHRNHKPIPIDNLKSPPPRILHQMTSDISPIDLGIFDRQRQQTLGGAATLTHTAFSGSGDHPPNEVSYLKSESSSTGAEERGNSYDTATQEYVGNYGNSYVGGGLRHDASNQHPYGPQYEASEQSVGHYRHPLPNYPPPRSSGYEHNPSGIKSSPVVPRRQQEPQILPQWGQYPSQCPIDGRNSHGQHHYSSYPTTEPPAPFLQHPQGYQPADYYPNNPVYILRSIRKAFEDCSYMLHCVESSDRVCPVNIHPSHLGVMHYRDHQMIDPNPDDLKIAIQRVHSAIFAFGGCINPTNGGLASKTKSSIFRRLPLRRGDATQPTDGSYQDMFHKRYFIKGHGISWEVEENPLIDTSCGEVSAGKDNSKNSDAAGAKIKPLKTEDESGSDAPSDNVEASSSPSSDDPNSDTEDAPSVDHNKKMKYRCKLCGQPKQNHSCPYRRSLQRSIAVSVVPVVNGYTAEEPGVLTAALSEMNNFVSYAGSSIETAIDVDVEDATERSEDKKSIYLPAQVTPIQGGIKKVADSPQNSSVSTEPTPGRPALGSEQRLDTRKRTPKSAIKRGQKRPNQSVIVMVPPTGRPRLFADTLVLRPEHYRAVSQTKMNHGRTSGIAGGVMDGPGAFEYLPVPVSFQGRKRLSDTLFYLAKSIPCFTGEVAALLRTAREREEWDLAVAEILTQVIVALYCAEGDHRLEGMRNYLLNIGIST